MFDTVLGRAQPGDNGHQWQYPGHRPAGSLYEDDIDMRAGLQALCSTATQARRDTMSTADRSSTENVTDSANAAAQQVADAAKTAAAQTGDAIEASVERIRELNEQAIQAARTATQRALDAYQAALESVVNAEQKLAEGSQLDWFTTLVSTQAEFTQRLGGIFLTAAREQLK